VQRARRDVPADGDAAFQALSGRIFRGDSRISCEPAR
jgi:hypothetical protein